MNWAPTQQELIRFAGDGRNALYAVGPTQSGKSVALGFSFACYILANDWPKTGFDGFAVMAPRMEQVKAMLRNIEDAADMLGAGCEVNAGNTANLAGHHIQGVSIGNQNSRRSFHGKRYGAVLIDEATLCDRETIEYAEGRVNKAPVGRPTGKFFSATNPDGPAHWWKKERIDRFDKSTTGIVVNSSIDDNPSLSDEYKAMLHDRWHGAMLKRMYYGEWAAHSGLIYPFFQEQCLMNPAPDAPPVRYDLSIDHATATVTHALLWAVYPNQRRVVKEWRYSGEVDGYATTGEQAAAIKEWLGHIKPTYTYVDPAALHMSLDVSRALDVDIENTTNDVLPGLQQCMTLMANGWVGVETSCEATVYEMGAYRWDPKAAERGMPDQPLKKDDHAPDAFRYYLHSESQRVGVSARRMV